MIQQGEGGEQGDPLMQALFSLGQHPVLEASRHHLCEAESLVAFLDDIYVVCRPARAGETSRSREEAEQASGEGDGTSRLGRPRTVRLGPNHQTLPFERAACDTSASKWPLRRACVLCSAGKP